MTSPKRKEVGWRIRTHQSQGIVANHDRRGYDWIVREVCIIYTLCINKRLGEGSFEKDLVTMLSSHLNTRFANAVWYRMTKNDRVI